MYQCDHMMTLLDHLQTFNKTYFDRIPFDDSKNVIILFAQLTHSPGSRWQGNIS